MATPAPKRLKRFINADVARQMVLDDDDNAIQDYIPDSSDDERLDDEDDDDDYELRGDVSNSDDDGDDDDDDTEDSDGAGPSTRNDRTPRTWKWVKRDLPPHTGPTNELRARGPALNCRTPLEMFLAHCDDELLDLMLLETNRHRLALQKHHIQPITKDELRVFIGICLFMTIVDLPFRGMYWSAATKQHTVSDAMTCNRFEHILSIIHLNDNELMKPRGEAGYDRLHRVRPIIDRLNVQFDACAEQEVHVSADEQIIPFKGRHSLKVYMMKKTKKWGYKVWVLAGTSGYVQKFMFAGDTVAASANGIGTVGEDLNVGKSGEIVLALCRQQQQGNYVYFDNYFASPDLLLEMKRRGLHATCTLRANRTKKCPLLCQKDLKKKGRGSYDYRSDEDQSFVICEWFDNKLVLVGSNVHGVEATIPVTRYDRRNKRHITVPCPALIKEYNQNMGGVNKCDMLLALYRNTMKGKKWYKRVLFHLIDLCVVNSWLLYKASNAECKMQLAMFKLDVARGLIKSRQPNQSQSAKCVSVDARYDRVDHFSKRMDVKNGQRCKLEGCKRKSMFMCCVYLCISGKDGLDDCFCFTKRHRFLYMNLTCICAQQAHVNCLIFIHVYCNC